MAVTTPNLGYTQQKGIDYTKVTDNSSDWSSIPNLTYFYDKADKMVHYKNASGTVLNLFGSSSGSGSNNTTGNVLYVSSTGSDSDLTRAGHLGDINKPFLTLKAARDAAISGDVIYVHPQTFTFDNSTGAYDLIVSDLNLWKNGVTYYWSPGCKINMIARVLSPRVDVWLFKPINNITAYETCTSIGYLEYEQYQVDGASSTSSYFGYDGTTTGIDYGCTFYSQTKSQIATGNALIGFSRGNSASTSSIFNLTFISDYESHTYINGAGGDFTYVFFGSTASDLPMTINSHVKERKCFNRAMLSIRNKWGPNSFVSFTGDIVTQTGAYSNVNYGKIVDIRNAGPLTSVNISINKMYVSNTTANVTGTFSTGLLIDDINGSSGTVVNIKGDVFPSSASATIQPIIKLFYNTTVNYEGNIYTNTNSGAGNQTILWAISSTSIINMKGNIVFLGTSTNTNTIFTTASLGQISFTGNITGNFANTIAKCGNGTIEIYNSNIKSIVSGASSYLCTNGTSTLGTIRINNSYVELKNPTNLISNGSYVNNYINNSIIINTGGAGLSNTTNFGFLQLLNSTLITGTAGATSINYTGTAPVISGNGIVNNVYNINTMYGDISTITEITA